MLIRAQTGLDERFCHEADDIPLHLLTHCCPEWTYSLLGRYVPLPGEFRAGSEGSHPNNNRPLLIIPNIEVRSFFLDPNWCVSIE